MFVKNYNVAKGRLTGNFHTSDEDGDLLKAGLGKQSRLRVER